MINLRRILIPTNHGGPSKAAVRYGVAFARQFDARLYLVHVLPESEFEAAIETERVIETLLPESLPDEQTEKTPNPAEIARNAARGDLRGLLQKQEEIDSQAEYLLRSAGTHSIGDAIVACAKELEIEMIVMGKHRLGFVEHLLAGSVTEKVIRHAPCPVLTVQHSEREFITDDDADAP